MSYKVLSRPRVVSTQGRHAFDRSCVRNFNTSAGIITPVLCEPCIAGTKGKINRRVFTRSAQVVAPNFSSVQQHFDFIKVPIRLLLSSWNDWKLNINDINSSQLVASSITGIPNLSLPTSLPSMDFGNNLVKRVCDAYALLVPTVTLSEQANKLNDLERLLPLLGYGSDDHLFDSAGNSTANILNLIPLAAYQKAYYDLYRNTTYESNNPYAYNLDWLYMKSSQILDLTQVEHAQHFFDMSALRYVNYRNDYFHNIYPSLNYSSSSPYGINWSIPSSVMFDASASTSPVATDVSIQAQTGGQTRLRFALNSSSPSSAFGSVQQIRAAFALDKLARASAYAPKHVRDQFKARFGVDVGSKVSNECERIGSFVHDIVFGEVTSTSDTVGASLGELGAKGVGGHDFGEDIEFYCEEDSIILGLTYFMPRAMYDVALDEYNMKLVREDFFQPEFENLGLRPIYRKNIYPDFTGQYMNTIVGYTVPNQRYKLGKDQNTGLFCRTMYYFNHDGTNVVRNSIGGPLQSFTTSNISQRLVSSYISSGVNYEYFKVKPEDLASLFSFSDPSYENSQFGDQFYGNVRIKFATVQGMSVHGQPSL